MKRLLPVIALILGCGDPPPAVVECADSEVLDGETCVPADCGVGPFGDLEPDPDGPTWHVLAAAEAPGDGSAEAPFPRLSSAMEAAVEQPGGRVLIGAGTYAERLSFNRGHDGLELAGRCTELVTVDGGGLAAPTLSIFASSVVVRRIRITGGRPGVIAGEVPGAPGLVLRGNDLLIEDNGGYGVLATGQGVLVDLAETVVRTVEPTNELSPGRGIGVDQSARLLGIGVTVEDVAGVGVQVQDGIGELEDSHLSGGRPQAAGTYGRALHVVGGELTLRRSEVAAHPERAVVVEAGGSLVMEDATIDEGGLPSQVVGGAEVALVRVAHVGGLQVHGANSFAALTDSSLSAGATAGPLLTGEEGAAVALDGVELTGGHGVGVHLAGDGTVGQLEDTDVRSTTAGNPETEPGIGVLVSDGASLEGDDLGVLGAAGPGLMVTRAATARCVSCALEGTTFAGALATRGATLRLDGGRVTGTRAHVDLGGGVGALGVGGGEPTILRIDDTAISDADHAGIALRGAGSWRVASAIVETTGQATAAPGLLATEGTGFWQQPDGPGLFVFGVTFRQLPNDAILMDGATGTVSGSTFDGVGQLELYTQNCDGVSPPDVAEALATNDCSGPPRILGPPLDWPEAPTAPGV